MIRLFKFFSLVVLVICTQQIYGGVQEDVAVTDPFWNREYLQNGRRANLYTEATEALLRIIGDPDSYSKYKDVIRQNVASPKWWVESNEQFLDMLADVYSTNKIYGVTFLNSNDEKALGRVYATAALTMRYAPDSWTAEIQKRVLKSTSLDDNTRRSRPLVLYHRALLALFEEILKREPENLFFKFNVQAKVWKKIERIDQLLETPYPYPNSGDAETFYSGLRVERTILALFLVRCTHHRYFAELREACVNNSCDRSGVHFPEDFRRLADSFLTTKGLAKGERDLYLRTAGEMNDKMKSVVPEWESLSVKCGKGFR